MIFYLGTHQANWLGTAQVPLFVSDRRLRQRRTYRRALAPWALDSGGFSELSMHGSWIHGPSPKVYANRVRRYAHEIGSLDFAAPQDWMCEPWITDRTGLTVEEHQARTVGNFLDLKAYAPDVPIIPVLQGWKLSDYVECAERYESAGVRLSEQPAVGLGSVCRRQDTAQIEAIVKTFAGDGLRLHGFGVKLTGISSYGKDLWSADSMAWSYSARLNPRMPGCTHKSCSNCLIYALHWRDKVITRLPRSVTS